jgi:CheY-like chemotaxis protein
MGGELRVRTEFGSGSTFSFSAVFGMAEKREIAPVGSIEDFLGRRALIIDANPNDRLIYREAVNSWGFVCTRCSSGEQGIALLSKAEADEEPISLVILDHRPPIDSGFETAQKIRAVMPRMPIVILSSENELGDALRCQEMEAAAYAVKPVQRTDLLQLIFSALGNPHRREQSGSCAATCANGAVHGGMRILIAEDSQDNAILLQAYLKSTPYILTFAEDGRYAVNRVMTSEFDLILMDMQMPVLDGLSAVRVIRAVEREQGRKRTPIVALTASALALDVQESLAAGCDQHLTKPISKQKLLKAIEQYGKEPVSAMNDKAITIEMPKGLEEIVPGYLNSRKGEVPLLLQLLAASDFDRIRIVGHNMKGSGSAYGFPELTAIGAALESSALDADIAKTGEQLHCLKEYLERVQLETVK